MDKNVHTCIIAVGYNRPDSMERLLNSLQRADYTDDMVDLLISIDKGARQSEVIEVAEKFSWKNGKKTIRAYSERQGLRPHIIQCGDMTQEYDAVIVLEDDITVSDSFYIYSKAAVSFYEGNSKIGGISLYAHQTNVGVNHFFEPEFNGYDTYLMQFAQSWGQCWTKAMWRGFKEWYLLNQDDYFSNNKKFVNIPNNILGWDNHSWLKFYMAYIVEKDLYFVYPYHSLSTNHSEVGQHNTIGSSSDYQVALTAGKRKYEFPTFDNAVKYDVFFERVSYKVTGYEEKKVILDLYGNKKNFDNGDILISSQCLPYYVLETWKLAYRPHEINCKFPQQGNAVFVYDLHKEAISPKADIRNMRTRYDVRAISWKLMLKLALAEFKSALQNKLKKRK